MNISNSFNYNLYTPSQQTRVQESSTHPEGCQCPGCNCDDASKTSVGNTNVESSDRSGTLGESEESVTAVSGIAKELTTEEELQVAELQSRDIEVRAHEAAHIAAGGSSVTGGASFTYQKGPDGKQYAIGGEVPIAIGGSSPEERIANAQAAQAGALAPASPSGQDLKVAASAAQVVIEARAELAEQKRQETQELRERAKSAYEENGVQTPFFDENSNSVPQVGISGIDISA